MTMKKLYIEITNNEHLTEACFSQAKCLGYTIQNNGWHEAGYKWDCLYLDSDVAALHIHRGFMQEGYEEISIKEFFALTKDDVIIKPKQIRLNVTQIKEKFGIDEDTNLILED
jgi:hypothetical protein